MVAQEWQIEAPRVLDVGDEDERVTALEVGVIAGRVDVVTHDDSPTARLEVTHVEGLPVRVRWDGGTLRVIHGKDDGPHLMEMLKRTFEMFGRNRCTISLSVPVDTKVTVGTVSAAAVVSGLHSAVSVNTVSGPVTVSDLDGHLTLNTVSGAVEGDGLAGPTNVNTVSGDVTLQRSELPKVTLSTVSGDLALDLLSGRSTIASNSVSGDVTVRAPLQGFDVEAHTASGQVVVDGRRLPAGKGYGFSGDNGRLTEGDGALKVKAHAVSGNVVVLRSSTPQDRPAPSDATVEH
jgi:hypothetical protein